MVNKIRDAIPYFSTTRYKVSTMIRLSNATQIDRVADLGTGDGRIAVAYAKVGAWVDAYEIDDNLIQKTKDTIKKEHVEKNVKIIKKDFWNTDLSMYDIIAIYPMPDIMEDLELKLQKELHSGARVVTNYYPFPNWKITTAENNIYLYIK